MRIIRGNGVRRPSVFGRAYLQVRQGMDGDHHQEGRAAGQGRPIYLSTTANPSCAMAGDLLGQGGSAVQLRITQGRSL